MTQFIQSHQSFGFQIQNCNNNKEEISNAVSHRFGEIYREREVESEKIDIDDSDAFVTASQLLEQYEETNSDTDRQNLLEHLKANNLDADCGAMLFRFRLEDDSLPFAQLACLGMYMLCVAQQQENIRAEICIANALIRLVIDDGQSGNDGFRMATLMLEKLKKVMTLEDRYDTLAMQAHALELLLAKSPQNQHFIEKEISIRQKARKIAEKVFPGNFCMHARLLVLMIGQNIGTQPTKEQTLVTRKQVQAIVDDLNPLEILRWIDSTDSVTDEEVADTLAYIALCIIHGHIPQRKADFGLKILRRAKTAGASDDIVALWL